MSSNDRYGQGDGTRFDLQTKEHRAESVLWLESEEFNMLRKELHDHWQDPPDSQLLGARTLWWHSGLMVQNPPAFVEICALELNIPGLVFDSANQADICWKILCACRKVRGVPQLERP